MPKRTAFRKMAKRGVRKGRGTGSLTHGSIGRISQTYGRISARQIEASRRAIRHTLNRQGMLWIRVFPHRPVTAKPSEVRMGGGTGSVKYWATMVKPGTVLFELTGVSEALGTLALASGSKKLPIHCGVITRQNVLMP